MGNSSLESRQYNGRRQQNDNAFMCLTLSSKTHLFVNHDIFLNTTWNNYLRQESEVEVLI